MSEANFQDTKEEFNWLKFLVHYKLIITLFGSLCVYLSGNWFLDTWVFDAIFAGER